MSEVIFLGKLVERIVAGKIRVPRFQRTFVWKQGDLHKLLESILRGFPIGSILVWDTAEEIASTERIGPVKIGSPPDGSVGYLLDGQQRVSTLGSGSSIWRLLPSLFPTDSMAGAPACARFSSILNRSDHVRFKVRENSIPGNCSLPGESGESDIFLRTSHEFPTG